MNIFFRNIFIGIIAIVFFIVIGIALQVSLSASKNLKDNLSLDQPLTKEIDIAEWKTIQSRGVGVEIMIPKDWEMDQDRSEPFEPTSIPGASDRFSRLFWDPSKMLATGSQVSFEINRFWLPDGDPLISFIEKEKDEDLGEDAIVSELEDTTLAGLPAIRYEIDAMQSTEPVIMLEVVAKNGNQYYEVEAMTDSAELYEANLPIFEEIIKSIRIF